MILMREDITYTVEVAKDYLFEDVIFQKQGLVIPEAETELPEAGQYFVRVRGPEKCVRLYPGCL